MSSTSLEDAARAARSGGRRDMERFLDALRPLVCRWALVWTGSPDAAEDVAQSVLVRVHRSFASFEGTGRVSTWAYKITRNVLIDFDQATSRERRRRDGLERDVSHVLGERGNALELMAQFELLERFMAKLTRQQRAALDLVAIQGFGHTEAADMLGVSESTLRVHLHRARLAMRAQADATDDDGDEELTAT